MSVSCTHCPVVHYAPHNVPGFRSSAERASLFCFHGCTLDDLAVLLPMELGCFQSSAVTDSAAHINAATIILQVPERICRINF